MCKVVSKNIALKKREDVIFLYMIQPQKHCASKKDYMTHMHILTSRQ